MDSPNLLILCEVSDKATPYHATSSTSSWRVSAKGGIHCSGTIFKKSVQLLAYANDIDIIGRTKQDVTAAFSAIERESTKMGLAVNEGRTKTCGALILGLRSINIILIRSMNLFILATPLPPKMMSVWRSNAGSLLPTGALWSQ